MTDLTIDKVLAALPPTEAREYIFSRLDLESLKGARTVNKQWQRLVDPMLEFKLILSDATKYSVSKFGSDRSVESLSTSKFQGSYPYAMSRLNVKMLRVCVEVLDEPLSYLNFETERHRNQSRAQGGDDRRYGGSVQDDRTTGISQHNFFRLIGDFYYVNKLHIASLAVMTFKNPRMLSELYLPNLNELILTFCDGGFLKLLPFLLNYFPKLEKVNIANIADTRMDRTNLYSWIFGFLAKHYKTLHDVALVFPEGMTGNRTISGRPRVYRNETGGGYQRRGVFPDVFVMGPRLLDHKMPQGFYNLAISKLENLQLKKLTWDISMMEGKVGRFNMGTTLLLAQKQLTTLHLDNLESKDLNIWNKLSNLIQDCSATLQSVMVGGCFCEPFSLHGGGENGLVQFFNCSWLKNCKNLTNFEVTVCGVVINNIEDLPKSLRSLNLGHQLRHEQIEYIALNMINLENWTLLQKASLINAYVPKIDRYLFETALHLPNLKKISLCSECAYVNEILVFAFGEPGIQQFTYSGIWEESRSGNLHFSISRELFHRDHAQLQNWIESYHVSHHLRAIDILMGGFVLNVDARLVLEEMVHDDGLR